MSLGPPVARGVLALREAHGLASVNAASSDGASLHKAVRLAVRCPTTTEQAPYSTSFPGAAALVRGRVDVSDVSGDAELHTVIHRYANRALDRMRSDAVVEAVDGLEPAGRGLLLNVACASADLRHP